jgi:hypothetical protein
MRLKQPTLEQIGERSAVLEYLAKMPSQTLIGPYEVATILDVAVTTICNSRYRSKSLFPSPLAEAGTKLRWRIGDVFEWVNQQKTEAEVRK